MRWPAAAAGASRLCRRRDATGAASASSVEVEHVLATSRELDGAVRETAVLARLHEAEMPLRQRERPRRAAARRAPECRARRSRRSPGRAWRALPTRLRITPATRHPPDRAPRSPSTSAAADCAHAAHVDHQHAPAGRACAARSAVLPAAASGRPPSNRPITPSTSTSSAPRGAPRPAASSSLGRHRPAVEVEARRAGRGGVEGRVDVVRPGLGGRTATPRRAGRRSSASVTVVLPRPSAAPR